MRPVRVLEPLDHRLRLALGLALKSHLLIDAHLRLLPWRLGPLHLDYKVGWPPPPPPKIGLVVGPIILLNKAKQTLTIDHHPHRGGIFAQRVACRAGVAARILGRRVLDAQDRDICLILADGHVLEPLQLSQAPGGLVEQLLVVHAPAQRESTPLAARNGADEVDRRAFGVAVGRGDGQYLWRPYVSELN